MVTKEIKHFTLKVGKYENIGVSVPFSVLSALEKEGIVPDPYRDLAGLALASVPELGAEAYAEFDIDPVILGMDNLLLALEGLDGPAVVIVNGVPMAGISHAHVPTVIDIKSKVVMGTNSLKIRFSPRKKREGEYLEDVALFAPVILTSKKDRC